MKKIFLFTCLLLVSTAAMAEFDMGVKVGYTSSVGFGNIKSVGDYDMKAFKNDFSSGFHAGVFMRMSLVKKWLYLQPEVNYNFEKRDYDFNISDLSGLTDLLSKQVTTSTLDVPILAGIKFLDLKIINLRVLAGPKLRFNLGSKSEFDGSLGGLVDKWQDQFRTMTVGLETGLGVELFNRVNVDVRYNLIRQMSKSTNWGDKVVSEYNDPLNGFVVSLGLKLF